MRFMVHRPAGPRAFLLPYYSLTLLYIELAIPNPLPNPNPSPVTSLVTQGPQSLSRHPARTQQHAPGLPEHCSHARNREGSPSLGGMAGAGPAGAPLLDPWTLLRAAAVRPPAAPAAQSLVSWLLGGSEPGAALDADDPTLQELTR